MVYLDYNATTPLAAEAREAMRPYLEDDFGNASSIHLAGRRARAAVDDARERLAARLKARPHELIFTSGGTEANNLAILGIARKYRGRGRHLITAATEHHAVLHPFEHLAKHEGFELTVLPVDERGVVDPEALRAAIRRDTILASVMSANNETGTRQDIAALAKICREHGVFFHSDVIQTFGKEPLYPHELGLDAISLAAHKFYGPKGAGLLWLRAGVSLESIQYGGAHENQRRPGTENVAAIAGMAAAAELAGSGDLARIAGLRDALWEGIQTVCPDAIRNGHPAQCLANTLNVSFPDADGETLLAGLDLEGICVSSGSACMVGSVQPSHVLLAMGLPPGLAGATVRFSLGKFNQPPDIDKTLAALLRVWERQREFPIAHEVLT
ncbi:MAG TPA: cysteine desulfurase family protein [Chthoniobacterales bacterium]